jgi:uncharacterized protein (DUF302 family)
MKNLILLIVIAIFTGPNLMLAQDLAPFINVGKSSKNMNQTTELVNNALQEKGFEIIGEYSPQGKPNFRVIVFSRKDLQSTVLKVKDRGALAAALKVGLNSDGSNTAISYVNPEYLFNAYLRDNYPMHESALKKIESDVTSALSPLGDENSGFGGSLTVNKLRKYHYKMMMPYFSDPVELKEFNSFEEGVKTIEKNLAAKKGNTKLVYSLNFVSDKVAVFGVGLLDAATGEGNFLPIIGEDHLAAMPYEIILQNKTATMLHGRFRIALFWPGLSMGTFMKIMSTPGNIEDTLQGLVE